MHVFYSDSISGKQIVLSREESTHAIKVLRLQSGDEAIVLDGKGHRYQARYEDMHQKQCFFSVQSVEDVPRRPIQLTMAVAPTKQIDRFEWFLEKATEIGIERIVPMICQHSERKVVKTERSQKVLIAAMKQSRTAWLPEISEPIPYRQFLAEKKVGDLYLAHCYKPKLPHLHSVSVSDSATVLIGPEGDFSTDEVQQAMDSGFKEISLGQNRLRTETAALVAVHTISLKTL